jgi:hypothetical protein
MLVTDPPKIAATEIPMSIITDGPEPNEKVRDKSNTIACGPAMPGKIPKINPSNTPPTRNSGLGHMRKNEICSIMFTIALILHGIT